MRNYFQIVLDIGRGSRSWGLGLKCLYIGLDLEGALGVGV